MTLALPRHAQGDKMCLRLPAYVEQPIFFLNLVHNFYRGKKVDLKFSLHTSEIKNTK
jgi:hypothetical protein